MERSQDVQWMCAAFDEAAVDFEVVALLTPHLLTAKNIRSVVGEETAFIVHDHLETNSRYASLLAESRAKSVEQPGVTWQPAEELFELSQSMTDSLRAICRTFRRSPHMLTLFKRSEAVAAEPWFIVLSNVAEFFQITKRSLVAMSTDDYVNREAQLEDLYRTRDLAVQREKELRLAIKATRADQAVRSSQGASAMEKITSEIGRLNAQLRQRQEKTASDTTTAIDETTARRARDIARLERIVDVEKEIIALQVENQERDLKSKKELRRLSGELDHCIAGFDEVMIDKTQKYEALLQLFDADAVTLGKEKELFETVLLEHTAYQNKIAEAEKFRLEEKRRLDASATTVQKVVRGYLLRRAMRRAQTAGKKKKDGGKGKKKAK